LVVVGEGRDLAALQASATPNVTLLGRQSRERIRELLRSCKAFIFPGLEDFGIAPVEAMSAGRPVIAFAGGGALDTVVPGVTGELFAEQSWQSLATVLKHFDADHYHSAACRTQAEKFSVKNFRQNLLAYLNQVLANRSLSIA
jgi:glycosyltransferase involved in cell wall biosynthesis